MRLHVLGSAPAWGNPGEACSGYLLEAGGGRIALDFGTGVLARLRRLRGAVPDAIVLSHLHPDHFADLVPLAYGLAYGDFGWERLAVHVPPGGLDALDRLAGAWGSTAALFTGPMDVHEYDPGAALPIGDASLTFAPAAHPASAHCIRVEASGRSLGYTGDGAPCEVVAAHLAGVHVLLAEAVLLEPDGQDGQERVHSTPGEAADLAVATRAGRLLLAHVGLEQRAGALRAARRRFPAARLALPGAVETV